MNLLTRLGSEDHPLYQYVHEENYSRYFSFLQTMIESAVKLSDGEPYLSHELIRAINFHATAGLIATAGQYRTKPVFVIERRSSGEEVVAFNPPDASEVSALMTQLVDTVNYNWDSIRPVTAASLALWRINHIHPFENGNGRTARAICYFIICVGAGGQLGGSKNLIELLRTAPYRERYVEGLKEADDGDLSSLTRLVYELVDIQLQS